MLEAGVVSEETYVEQGLYWSTAHVPMMEYVVETYEPDLLLAGMPTTDEFQHQFLGLVTPTFPGGAPNPAFDDVDLNGEPDGRVSQRDGFIRAAYQEADEVLTKARQLMGSDPTTFVSSDHGFAPQFLAVDASEPLQELGLLSANQTSNCRTATGETIGSAKACWAGGALQIYLNVAGRDPAPSASSTIKQIPATAVDATVANIKAAYLALVDQNDWTGDGTPEGWKVIDRVFTKAEARYIPNGPGTTTDMAHPTRTGDLVVFAFPPYQFDAQTPGTLVASSHFFGQHGYVPDVQDLGANVNMRATFLAGGEGVRNGHHEVDARTIDLAPTLAYLLGIPEPQHSQGRVLTEAVFQGPTIRPVNIIGLNDFHGQLDPTTMLFDGRNIPVGGAAFLATMFDEEFASLISDGLLLAAGDNVGASPPNSGCSQDIPTSEVQNAWGLDATSFGNHEFDYGVTRIIAQQAVTNFPWLAVNIVEEATGLAPPFVDPSPVFTVNGVRVGVIGAELESTPEIVAAGNTEGLLFLDEAERIAAESERLRQQGVLVQVVVIHQGTALGQNPIGNTPGATWEGPILPIADALQGTTVDAIIAGHTHRVSNLMRGHILVVEGINAGASYSVLQLMVQDKDVAWAGGATRIAKTIGVTPRADVQAIIDAANAATAVLRNQVIGTQVNDITRAPEPRRRVRDGEHGRGRDAAQVPGCRRRAHELGRLAAGAAVHTAQRGRAARRDHMGRDVRGAAVRQPHDDHHAHRSAAAGGVPQRLQRGVQPVDQHRTVPADLGTQGDLSLRWFGSGDRLDVQDRLRNRCADHADRLDPLRDERLLVRRSGRVHGVYPGDRRRAARRRSAHRRDRLHHCELTGRPTGGGPHHPRPQHLAR